MKYALLLALFFLFACTENEKAKNYGGTADLNLPPGRKLVLVTWKEADLWYLTRPMNSTDSVEVYEFNEESSWGIWEGTYIIRESR